MAHIEAPHSGRRGGFFALGIAAWVLLAASAVMCGLVTYEGLQFAHRMTCEPSPPPVVFRQAVVFTGLGLYAACAFSAVIGLRRGSRAGVIVALLLALAGIGISFFTFLIPVFVASLC